VSSVGPHPPRLARALLRWFSASLYRGAALGDLDEEYRRFVRPDRSRLSADLWYWRQVLGSIPAFLVRRSPILNGDLRRDVSQAFRILAFRPAFTIATVCSLGLGLGMNTAAFSVVNAVLVRPLPYENADRVVRPLPSSLFFLDASQALRLRERLTTVEDLAAWGRTLLLFDDGSEAVEVRGATVDWNHFSMLGATARLGRTFVREDAVAGDAVILSHGLWSRFFGGDPSVVGNTVVVSGAPVRIVGVMGPDYVPMETDWQAWRTNSLDAERATTALAVNLMRGGGVTLGEVESEFVSVWLAMLDEGRYAATAEERAEMVVVPLREWLLGDARASLLVLLGAVSLILLLACVNVANLLLAQLGRRGQEFGIRAALGGGGGAVVRQVLVELGLLAVMGGALGLALAWLVVSGLPGLLPAEIPRAGGVTVSPGVLLYGLIATLVATGLAGVVPVVRSSRDGAVVNPACGSRTATGGRGRSRLRSILVAAEMAFAVILVVGAGLMVRSFVALTSVDPGFDPKGVVTVRPSPPSSRYPGGDDLIQYYERVTARLAALPGVESVGGIQFLPMTSGGWWSVYRPEGEPYADDQALPRVAIRLLMPGYLRTMGQALLQGRDIGPDDAEAEEMGVLVNETLARAAFGDGNAPGRLLWLGSDLSTPVRVVGVVADVRQTDLRTPTHREIYMPSAYSAFRRMHLVVRAEGDPRALLGPVAAAVHQVDGRVPLDGPRLVTDVIGGTYSETRLLTGLLGLFGVIAVLVGAIGVYGVSAQAVSERLRELGVRIALGADRSSVATGTVARGMIPVGGGLVTGLAVAFLSVRFLESQLFGVTARDPLTLVVGPAVLAAVAFTSTLLPAFRASRVDPVEVLRQD
jgi:predicted permease